MEEVKVSIICLVYNHEKYIEKCLDSLVNQKTSFSYEVLIHDDASTDRSADIIHEYEKKYPDIIKPIYQTENQYSKGVKITPTFLLPRAKGKYLAWCEGDDYWCDEYKLQCQFNAMERNQQCAICVHNTNCVNEDGSNNERYFPSSCFQDGVIDSKKILEKYPDWTFHLTSFFIRKEVVYDLYYNNKLLVKTSPVGDLLLQYFSATKGNYFYINRNMSCYRLFSENSWTKRLKENNDTFIATTNRFIQFAKVFSEYLNIRFNNEFNDVISEAISEYEIQILLHQKNYKKINKYKKSKYFKTLNRKLRIIIVLSKILPFFEIVYNKFRLKSKKDFK